MDVSTELAAGNNQAPREVWEQGRVGGQTGKVDSTQEKPLGWDWEGKARLLG